jgi:hypothetical protein
MNQDRLHHEEYQDAHSYENDYAGAIQGEVNNRKPKGRCKECSSELINDGKEIFCKKCGLVQ